MSLQKAECTNCGATITVDPENTTAICPFCNSSYIVEKAIENYNVSVTNNVTNNIYAENVIISVDKDSKSEAVVKSGSNSKSHVATNKSKLYKITAAGVFSAIVVVLQCTLGLITVGTVNLNFVLIPIVIAGIIYGPFVGTVTGLAFGITVFIQCLTGTQAFGALLLDINWFFCFILCVFRGFLIGFVPAIIWKACSGIKNNYLRALIPSLVTPVVNTGFFLLGYAVLFNGHMHSIMPEGAGVIYFLFITLAGVNFVFEFVTSGLLIPPVAAALVKSLEKKAE